MKGRRGRPIALFDSTGMTEELRRSLNMIIVAVLFGMVWANITTGAAWTGYLRALGADEFVLGLIAAIPVAASACQLLASYLLEHTGKRRELFLYIGILSRLLWIPIGLIPYVVPMDAVGLRMTLIMTLLAMTAASGAFINVGFFSLVGDLVPMRIRGRYFGTRSAASLVASVLAGLLVSFLMDRVSGYIGYTIIFILAGIAGALDIVCFFRVSWPKMHKDPGMQKGPLAMIREVFQNKPFRKLVLTFTFWSFAVNISAPFFNVYMLEQIGMSYTEITLLNQVLPNVVAVFVMSWWGRRMDEYGNKPVMQLTGIHYMLAPLFWLFTGPRSFLILPIVNTLSGLMAPPFDLGTQNTYLGQAPERNRSMYVAVFFASTQLLGSALSNAVGGYLVQNVLPHLEVLNISLLGFRQTRYHFIFLISALLRVIMILGFLPRLAADADSKSMRTLIADIYLGLRDKAVFTVRFVQVQIVRRRVHRLRRLRRQAREQAKPQNQPIAAPLSEDAAVPEAENRPSEREE